MLNRNARLKKAHRLLWTLDLRTLPWWQAKLLWFLRLLYILGQDIAAGQLTLRAMSLVFTTMLALVPLLAISFSVLKAFGINMVEDLLLSFLQPLGAQGVEISGKIIEFVNNIRVGLLGSVGLLFLFYTAVSTIQKVESAFNYIWQLDQNRSLLRRFNDFLGVLLIGPVFVFGALGISAMLKTANFMQPILAIETFGVLFNIATQLTPYLLIIAAFTFVYIFIPNTRVKFKAALIGGVVSGVVWQTCSWVFAAVVVSSTKYTAIYSGLAVLIVFMLWVYLNWLILLLGASITYYCQHPESLRLDRYKLQFSMADREKLCLELLALIGEHFYRQLPPFNVQQLAERLQAPVQIIDAILKTLIRKGIIAQSADDPVGYLPAVPFEKLPLHTVLQALREDNDRAFYRRYRLQSRQVEEVIGKLEYATEQALQGLTVKDMLEMQKNSD